MKTTINELFDYREVPFEHHVVIRKPDAAYMRKKMNALTRSHKETLAADTVEQGDVVTLALESELPKFNKPLVPVTVGGGLYDAELEAQLTGLHRGDTAALTVQGKPVTVTVKDVRRTVYPAPTDEDVRAFAAGSYGMEGIETVEAYRAKLVKDFCDDQRSSAIYGTMQDIMNYVLTHSDWEFDEGELNEFYAQSLEDLRDQMRRDADMELDDMTDEQIKRFIGMESRAAVEQRIREEAEPMIASFVWLAVCNGKDPAELTVDEAASLGWEFLEKYVRDSITFEEEI